MSRASRPLLLAGFVVLSVGCAMPSSTPPGMYALVYGVSRYLDAWGEGQELNLTYCDDDARSMAALLEANGYTVFLRTDAQASKDTMESDVAALALTVEPDDLVLFYFSGHGGVLWDFGLSDASGSSYPTEARWIFPYGSIDPSVQHFVPSDLALDKALYGSELDALMATLPCARRVVVLDSCNSGGFIRSGADVDALPGNYSLLSTIDRGAVFARALEAYAAGLGLVDAEDTDGVAPTVALVIAAAGVGESSFEDLAELRHGVFTYFFLEAGTLGDLNGDGWVTATEAYLYAAAGIQESWNGAPGMPAVYHFLPHISGGPVDLALFRVP